MEYNPEVFGRVLMLYVPMSVNGVKLQAFVDSGAQSTIMSVQCAERTGIMRLIDKRYAGVAKGVGSAKILGRVHQVPCVIGTKHVAMSFTIVSARTAPRGRASERNLPFFSPRCLFPISPTLTLCLPFPLCLCVSLCCL